MIVIFVSPVFMNRKAVTHFWWLTILQCLLVFRIYLWFWWWQLFQAGLGIFYNHGHDILKNFWCFTKFSCNHKFTLSEKKTSHKPLKVAAAKKSFPSACTTDTTCFDECFLFHVIYERHYFLCKFIVTQRFGTIAMLLRSFKQVFWIKSAFYIRLSSHDNAEEAQNKTSTT